jgi:hypothetical protein
MDMNFSSLNLLDVVHDSDSSLSVGLLAVTDKLLYLEFWVTNVSKTLVTDEHV